MKILFYSDTHHCDSPPRRRRPSYREDLLTKEAEVLEIVLEERVDLVIHGGDVFHSKKGERISYYLLTRLMEIYREMPKLIVVPGNHDIEGRMEWVNRPLGVLSRLPNCIVAHGEWQVFDGFQLGLFGGGELFTVDDVIRFLEIKKEGLYSILVAHLPIAISGSYPFMTWSPTMFRSVDAMLLAHLHKERSVNLPVLAAGSLSRAVFSWDELDREVGVLLLEVSDKIDEVEFRCLKNVRPGEEVFRVEEKIEEEVEEVVMGSFLDAVRSLPVFPRVVEDWEDLKILIRGSQVDEKVKQRAILVVEKLERG